MQPELMQWKVFCEGQCNFNLQDYDGVHFFNSGRSVFLIKEANVYAIGEHHKCCLFPDPGRTIPSWLYGPVLIKNLNNKGIQALSTGSEHAVLLDNDGHVFCWGSNACGQLGSGAISSATKPYRTHLEDITQISCGESFTIALSKHNELWLWGEFRFSDYHQVMQCTSPTFIKIPGSPSIKLISASQHVALLADNGKVFSWGRNSFRRLGQEVKGNSKIPQLVLTSVKFKYVQCGRDMIAFVSEDGQLYYANSSTKNIITCLSETNTTCKNIASFAMHWRSQLIIAVNENGHCFKSIQGRDNLQLLRISQDILSEFIDIGTPSIQPNQWLPGITPIRSKQLEELEENKCMGHVDVTHLYDSKDFSDIQIKLSDGILHLHKLILAAKSAIFSQRILENTQLKILDMSNMNASSYRTYLKYLYTGTLEIKTLEDIPEIYFLGDQDKNEIVKKLCMKTWKDLLNKENVLSAFLAAYSQHLQALLEACGPTLQLYLKHIMNSEQYSRLTNEDKLSLLTIASLSTSK